MAKVLVGLLSLFLVIASSLVTAFSTVAPTNTQISTTPLDIELFENLATKNFHAIRQAIDPQVLQVCSQLAIQAYERHGGHDGTYLEKPWKSSRIYIDGAQFWSSTSHIDSSYMEPMIQQVRQMLNQKLCLGATTLQELESVLPLESAFCNFYFGDVTDPSIPRDMANHVDCNCQETPVPLSCVVQGIYDSPLSHSEEILGVLDCQDYRQQQPREAVALAAGDALLLAKAYHQPRPVPDNVRRMVFVFFFQAVNPLEQQ